MTRQRPEAEGEHGVPQRTMRAIVRHACMAPSVHNTQPWSWRATGHTLELHADPRRRLTASDPAGCNMTISCGAALHHAEVAASAFGWAATMTRLPEHDNPLLLARIQFTPAEVPRNADDLLQAIRERSTDRRRFTSWPVPQERLQQLATIAADRGADAMVISQPAERLWTELLVGQAVDVQAADPLLAEEQRRWVDHSEWDGVPETSIPEARSSETAPRSRYGSGLLAQPERHVRGSDGLLLLSGPSADAAAFLRTGEGLSALWLRATVDGLSVVPLSQVVEVDDTRETLCRDVLHGRGVPHLLVRVGWQAIGRSTVIRTPRRPLNEVLTL